MVDKYIAEICDVFSGDDLSVMIDLGIEGLHKRQRVRLHGVDTPNAIGMSPSTEAGKVRAYVRKVCYGKRLVVTVISRNVSSWVCRVDVLGGGESLNLNDDLISKGYKFNREKTV